MFSRSNKHGALLSNLLAAISDERSKGSTVGSHVATAPSNCPMIAVDLHLPASLAVGATLAAQPFGVAIPQLTHSGASGKLQVAMAFPTLSRRHVATPINRCKRRSHRYQSHRNCNTPKVSSPLKCERSESLRSTWMTSGSDSMEEDPDVSQETDADSEALQVFVQLQRPLSDWVYWQRDAVALPDCWTKVFAVFCGNILWLYRYEDASAKSLLVRMRVTALDDGNDGRQLLFRDATTATSVQLYMPDASAFSRWHSHVSTEIAKFPSGEEEEESARQSAEMVPAVASAMKKKRFWKALAAAIIAVKQVLHYEDLAPRRDAARHHVLPVLDEQRRS
ncbi:uncharacterized protein PITG_05150 [Phytophthora infestans T30-4]|uniref:PH domain-containing protein n=1 Tax=Phytophthora infestans (strain T30-4) TaxID=403677 RepID=D0N3N8_PHYIT|nr:uncharacterized protein PITG_05150 [Phytophthora infestans T30-4]EEY68992.1 conserved hypothetical protein [Phytophthora infestans T30-4]|eukprot:XP_002998846.1 conserved hypothetical protein [Phytophthora infestans T30-4]